SQSHRAGPCDERERDDRSEKCLHEPFLSARRRLAGPLLTLSKTAVRGQSRVRRRCWPDGPTGGEGRRMNGGRSRARTCDPGLVRAVLSQLSYPPMVGFSRTCARRSIDETADVPENVPASLRATSWRSLGDTMW